MAVSPKVVIHQIKIADGASMAARINSRTVRPVEMRATNIPTKGEKAIHQAQ